MTGAARINGRAARHAQVEQTRKAIEPKQQQQGQTQMGQSCARCGQTLPKALRQARLGQAGADQQSPQNHPEQSGTDHADLDPGIGANQLLRGNQFRDQPILGRRIGRCAQPHQRVGQHWVETEQEQGCA